jgi:uncharacterized repeat protein (TIGR01451 family)
LNSATIELINVNLVLLTTEKSSASALDFENTITNLNQTNMKKSILLLLLLAFSLSVSAQWQYIPDDNFAAALSNIFPNCMDGNMLDTSCPEVAFTDYLNVSYSNISNLDGVQYFPQLTTLDCSHNNLTSLPNWPQYLSTLICSYNNLSSLSNLPFGLTLLACDNNNLTSIQDFPPSLVDIVCGVNNLTSLPTLPSGLTYLRCDDNDLTSLPALPNSLGTLNAANNNLTELPTLPAALEQLYCNNNNINSLPQLPNSLIFIHCNDNQLTTLPTLPGSLLDLYCNNNSLTSLPDLPSSLFYLYCQSNNLTSLPELTGLTQINTLDCSSNNLTSLPELPTVLNKLYCNSNEISSLPSLPPALGQLRCSENNLTELPDLPASLGQLFCNLNNISDLPDLPSSLSSLHCYGNNLTYLQDLPPSLISLRCQSNQLNCLPVLPMSLTNSNISSFDISDNPFTCLPNYVPAMTGFYNEVWLTYPLCDIADVINNPYNCSSFTGIVGNVFHDEDTNCAEDVSETSVLNASVQLLDDVGDVIGLTYTFGEPDLSVYNFVAGIGTYSIKLLTDDMPFQASCVDPGTEQSVTLTAPAPFALDVDFGVECVPGYDVGVQSVLPIGWAFPGQVHTLSIAAGDMSLWYGLQCAQGVGGTITVMVTGPVSYVGPAVNSLTPNLTGVLQFTYDIADFSMVDFQQDFNLLFETEPTAQTGELICVDIIVDPIAADINPINNTFNHCYQVVNSYDPNIKEVWPQNVEPGFDDYFNYTIYFQNTGTAPAFNIRLADTLDTNLDLSTFQVTNYSHPVLTYLHGNVLTFRFNNIMLPDSTTDLEGSIGSVQYRIKPIADLPAGTVIENTAHIFFDFNDAIVTNTTVNEYVIPTSVADISMPEFLVFPNPGNGLFNVSVKNGSNSMHQSTLEIYTLRGQRILQQQMNENQTVLDLSTQTAGIYMLRMQNTFGTKTMKLVKQ